MHCGQPDRLQHRFRACSATEAARKEQAFRAVLEQNAELISPWLPKPSSLDAWKEMLTVRWTLFQEILHGLQTRECKCAVWTDGSAVHQDATFSIDSAYAVVSADTATGTQRNLFHAGIGDEQLDHACNQAFKVEWTGKVPGRQSSDRGELAALVVTVHAFPFAVCYTDSEYAISSYHKALGATSEEIDKCANSGLLRLLAQGVNKHAARDFSLVKTKAHVSVGKIQSDNQRYISAGNWFADLAAKAAMRGDGKGAQDLHTSVVTQEKNILDRFRILWHGLVLSTRQYIRARTQHDTQECNRPENSVEPGLAERDSFWRQGFRAKEIVQPCRGCDGGRACQDVCGSPQAFARFVWRGHAEGTVVFCGQSSCGRKAGHHEHESAEHGMQSSGSSSWCCLP